jgi:hypothetical protein
MKGPRGVGEGKEEREEPYQRLAKPTIGAWAGDPSGEAGVRSKK